MKKKDFEKWFPLENSATMHYIENIAYDDGLKITLSQAKGYNDDGEKIFVVHFPSYESYCEVDELYADGFWSDDTSKVWTFYKTTQSTYIDFLNKSPFFSEVVKEPIHYVFVTYDSIFHVISTVEPVFLL